MGQRYHYASLVSRIMKKARGNVFQLKRTISFGLYESSYKEIHKNDRKDKNIRAELCVIPGGYQKFFSLWTSASMKVSSLIYVHAGRV